MEDYKTLDKEGYRLVVALRVNAEGTLKINTAPMSKETIMRMLASAQVEVGMQKDNVTVAPSNNKGRISGWLKRKMKK